MQPIQNLGTDSENLMFSNDIRLDMMTSWYIHDLHHTLCWFIFEHPSFLNSHSESQQRCRANNLRSERSEILRDPYGIRKKNP